LFVARHAIQRVAERSRVERRDGDGIVALDALLASELEADGRVAAQFINGAIQGKPVSTMVSPV